MKTGGGDMIDGLAEIGWLKAYGATIVR